MQVRPRERDCFAESHLPGMPSAPMHCALQRQAAVAPARQVVTHATNAEAWAQFKSTQLPWAARLEMDASIASCARRSTIATAAIVRVKLARAAATIVHSTGACNCGTGARADVKLLRKRLVCCVLV